MADWTEGYTSSWEVRAVDVDTWDDAETLTGVRSVSIQRSSSEPLLETASIELDGSDFSWSWCRIYAVTDQAGLEKHALATLLFEKASARHERGTSTMTANGRSVLQPLADRRIELGGFAPAGTDGAARIGRFISECTPAPVTVEGSFTLSDDVVFDINGTYLDAVRLLLDASGWCIKIDGRGGVHVRPKPESPSLELTSFNLGMLMPGIGDDFSMIDVPNRYIAVHDEETAIATNENPDSPTSFQSRGRWVDKVDESPTLVDGEPLQAYAARKLREASTITRSYTYSRNWWPDVFLDDMVRATIAGKGMEGDLRVSAQSISCARGIVVEETAGLEVVL